MRLRNLFNRKEKLGFKDIRKRLKKELKAIEKIEDPEERLARYKPLQDGLDEVFCDPDVKRASEELSAEKDRLAYLLRPTAVASGYPVFVVPILVLPALSGFYFLAPVVAGVAVVTILAGRFLVYRGRAKELGLTPRDVKYAMKVKAQHVKVQRAVKALSCDEATQKSLANLRKKFNQSSIVIEKQVTVRSVLVLTKKTNRTQAMRKMCASYPDFLLT